MADYTLPLAVPAMTLIPRGAISRGLLIVSAPELDEDEIDNLRVHVLDQLEEDGSKPAAIFANFDVKVLMLDEDEMREMGWVRATKE